MTRAAPDFAPKVDDAAAITELRSVFERAGYTGDGLFELFESEGGFMRDPAEIPVYLRRLPAEQPVTTMIKLFLLDLAVPEDEMRRAFAPLAPEQLVSLGLAAADDDGAVRALCNVYPSGDQWFASDMYEGESTPRRPDHVLGTSISSRILDFMTPRHPVGTALDLGTGCGVQALNAARHARSVVGVDINERAVRFARFNAALNGVENVEFRHGDLFEPVEGQAFDLLVSNPPYVISPDSDFVYRDSGRPGHTFTEALIKRVPEFLNEGGFATVLVEWVHAPGQDWSDPVREWVAASGCDALLLHYISKDPLSYAALWNRERRGDPESYAAAIDRWIEYDRRLGIEVIAWGAIVLRRRAGDNWVRALSLGPGEVGAAAHHVARLFHAHDYLRSLDVGHSLLDGVFALAPDHKLDQTLTVAAGQGVLEKLVLRLEGGFGCQAPLDEPTVRVVVLLDGIRPLHDVIAEAAGQGPEPSTPEELAAQVLPALVRLFELGLIVPGRV